MQSAFERNYNRGAIASITPANPSSPKSVIISKRLYAPIPTQSL